jgi:uncharacterized membrane protein YcaP (DUF421 family)
MLNLFVPEISIAEKVLRSIVVYLFIVVAFRLTGKRQVGQLTPFDLVLLFLLSNVVQNAVIGNDNSLGGGLIGAVTILLLNYAFVEVTYRSKHLRRVLEPYPTVLIHDGRVLDENLRRERLSRDDLHAALRKNGCVDAQEVRFAVLEANGGISVIPWAYGAERGQPSGRQGPDAPGGPAA